MNRGAYFALNANLPAAVSSASAPIEYAPHVPTYFSFVVISLPVFLIGGGRSHLWATPGLKMFAILLYVFSPNFESETWLNSINLMIHFGFVSLVLLCDDTRETGRLYGRVSVALLFLAGLSGVYSVFLLPAFMVKLLFERTPLLRRQVVALSIASIAQVGVFVLVSLNDGLGASRMEAVDVVRGTSAVVLDHIFKPILGEELGGSLFAFLGLEGTLSPDRTGYFYTPPQLLTVLGVFALLVALPTIRSRGPLRWVLLVALVTQSLLSTLGAKNGIAVGRYAMVPGMAFWLLLFSNLPRSSGVFRAANAMPLGIALAIGAFQFRDHAFLEYTPKTPRWSNEIALWRQDPERQISVWPYPRWKLYLPDAERMNGARQSMSALRDKIRAAKPVPRLSLQVPVAPIPTRFDLYTTFEEPACRTVKEFSFTVISGARELRHTESAGAFCGARVRTRIRLVDKPAFRSPTAIRFEATLSDPIDPASLIRSIEVRSHRPALFYVD